MTEIVNFEFDAVPNSQFRDRPAKPDAIKAVKLTQSNLKAVAAEVLKNTKLAVQLEDDGFVLSTPVDHNDVAVRLNAYRVGDWIIETYDYTREEVAYRRADFYDRQKYDLR